MVLALGKRKERQRHREKKQSVSRTEMKKKLDLYVIPKKNLEMKELCSLLESREVSDLTYEKGDY